MTTIRNGRGIAAVQYRQDARVAGEPIGHGFDRPYENPLLAQISTLTLAAQVDVSDEIVEAQVWTITLTDPDAVAYTTTYTVTAADNTAGTDGAGLAHMATRLAAAIEANDDLNNIVSATAAAAVITITWLHPNAGVWTVTGVCTPAAAETVLLATPATSQVAGGAVIPMGRFVSVIAPVGQGARRARLPNAATDQLAGVALRDITLTRPYDITAAAVDSYPIGSMVGVREEGDVAILNVGAAAALTDQVFTVISTTGGDALGAARPTRDGVAQVVTATPTAANDAVYELTVVIQEFEDLPAYSRAFRITADASATATEICDALRVLMAADALFTAQIVASGTATLVLTGQVLGRSFTVLDTITGAGDWASITTTTAAAQYTKLVPRATWKRVTAASTVGVVNLAR